MTWTRDVPDQLFARSLGGVNRLRPWCRKPLDAPTCMQKQLLENARRQNRIFKYSTELLGHASCVNTLSFSHDGGHFMISGSDGKWVPVRCIYNDDGLTNSARLVSDKTLLLWDVFDSVDNINRCAHTKDTYRIYFAQRFQRMAGTSCRVAMMGWSCVTTSNTRAARTYRIPRCKDTYS